MYEMISRLKNQEDRRRSLSRPHPQHGLLFKPEPYIRFVYEVGGLGGLSLNACLRIGDDCGHNVSHRETIKCASIFNIGVQTQLLLAPN